MNRFEAIDPKQTALIVGDMQVGFVTEGFPAYCRYAPGIVGNINQLSRSLRAAGGLVVHTRQTMLDDPERGPAPWQRDLPHFKAYFASLEPDAPGHPLHPDLDVEPGDLVIDKVRYSASCRHLRASTPTCAPVASTP
jgi:ureidoacrylate peracid hydrolase